jgi:hypothetical protein
VIHFVTVPGGERLLLPDEFSLDINSPYFEPGAVPGIASLPADLPWTRENLRGLHFPYQYRGPGGPAPVTVDCYVENVRWRRGRLVYLSVDAQAKRLRYNFVADAADLATRIKNVKLTTLDLGTSPLSPAGTAAYALLPVRNATFFGAADKAPAAYPGYLNYYAPGAGAPAAGFLAPQPYLVPLLRQVLAHYGYELTGSWAADPEIQTLCLYSDRLALDPALVTLNHHVPSIDVADLLLGVAGLFGLGLWLNPSTGQARFTPLREVVAQAAGGQRQRPGVWQASTANTTNGFVLTQEPDSNDELDKTLDTGWQKFAVGAGGEAQAVKAGTLHAVQVPDAGRSWLVAAYEGKGAVPGNADVGDESRVGLRLLFHRGYQPDSTNNAYPLGTALTTNARGQAVGLYSLRWDGPQGLYAQWHQAWLAFRARAVQHAYVSEFTVADLLMLDPSQADLVDYHLCFWEKVSLSFGAGKRLTSAAFTYQELL